MGTGMPGLALWANVLRVIGPDGVDQRELPALGRVSKRVVRSAVGGAAKAGWVVVEGSKPAGARAKVNLVRLTPEGRAACDAWSAQVAAMEDEWRSRFGSALDELRDALVEVVSRFDLELPHYPQSYGPADGSITGGVSGRWGRPHACRKAGLPRFEYDADEENQEAEAWEAESGGRLYVRGHGQDWRPVPRASDGESHTVSGLSLLALLSQAMVAISIDYEGSGGTSLANAANRFRLMDDDGVRVEGKPAVARALSSARHAYTEVVIDPDGKGGIYRLTDKGRAVRDVYRPLVAAIEKRWERRYGTATVRSLRGSLETIGGRLEGSFPHHPFPR